MNAKEKIEELLEASEDGTITAAQVTEDGLHRSVLQEFVKSGEMYRFGRGLYVRSSAWEDDFYLLQRKYMSFFYAKSRTCSFIVIIIFYHTDFKQSCIISIFICLPKYSLVLVNYSLSLIPI